MVCRKRPARPDDDEIVQTADPANSDKEVRRQPLSRHTLTDAVVEALSFSHVVLGDDSLLLGRSREEVPFHVENSAP